MKNWKTTAAGFLLAAVYYLKSSGVQPPSTKADWWNLIIAILFAGFGLVAKDFNVTHAPAPTVPHATDDKKL